MRRKLIVGNWKMHGSKASIAELLSDLKAQLPATSPTDMAVCAPFPYLSWVRQHLPAGVELGAQNVCAEPAGAFTGEVAASMLADCDCRFVIVGHSERRQLFGETDAQVVAKVLRLLEQGLTPLVCVGESLAAREANQAQSVIGAQLDALCAGVSADKVAECVIAYEPIWAIGTGRTATPEQAQEIHAFIRERMSAALGGATAAQLRILYGGSVKADNAGALFSQPDIDGGLIGGASLKADEFAAICRAAE
jgi:triosephosphate isomerase